MRPSLLITDHVNRNTDGAGLIGHGAGDRLPIHHVAYVENLYPFGVVELLHRGSAEAAFPNQVQGRPFRGRCSAWRDTTRRRFASSRWFFARSPSRQIHCMSRRCCTGSFSPLSDFSAINWVAYRPASMRLAS